MQPDLLSPEKEENPPETSSSEAAPPELPSTEAAADATLSPTVKKSRSKVILAYVGLGVLVLLLVAALGWVGYWTYDLNTQLTHTQQQLVAQQADYAKLQADYATLNNTLKGENEKLNTELAQVKADLEKANTDLATAQSDLSKSQDQSKKLAAKIDKASKLAEILYVVSTAKNDADFLRLDKLIRDSNNSALTLNWMGISSQADFNDFLDYLILATRDSLK